MGMLAHRHVAEVKVQPVEVEPKAEVTEEAKEKASTKKTKKS